MLWSIIREVVLYGFDIFFKLMLWKFRNYLENKCNHSKVKDMIILKRVKVTKKSLLKVYKGL